MLLTRLKREEVMIKHHEILEENQYEPKEKSGPKTALSLLHKCIHY